MTTVMSLSSAPMTTAIMSLSSDPMTTAT
jgi:hypothetical protein